MCVILKQMSGRCFCLFAVVNVVVNVVVVVVLVFCLFLFVCFFEGFLL